MISRSWPVVRRFRNVAISIACGASFYLASFALAEPASTGEFGPGIPFDPGLGGASGVRLNDGSVLLIGGSPLAYRFHPDDQTFQPTPAMTALHTSVEPVLLPDGRVLVASGGANPSEARSEIYNPTINTWALTGSMATARQWANVLVDNDGRVFVLGGQNASGQAINSVERYDVVTGQFVPAGRLIKNRTFAAGVKLSNGTFLIAGGIDADRSMLKEAEIYNPSTTTSIETASLTYPTYAANLVLLKDGRALLTGGWQSHYSEMYRVSSTAEIFNPSTGVFQRTMMSRDRWVHTATVLPSGEVLVVGGLNDVGVCQQTTGIFDPSEANLVFAFHLGPPLPSSHCLHAAVLLNDGSVLIAGGASENTSSGYVMSLQADRFYPDRLLASGFETP